MTSGFLRLLCPPLLLFASLPLALAQDEGLSSVKERELGRVRQRISELKDRLDDRAVKRDQMTGDLRAAEVRIAEKRRQLARLERQKNLSETKIGQLHNDIEARKAQLDAEIDQLGVQVRAAYVGGRQERIKLLLNQHDPAMLGRAMAYYRYLSKYRGQNIDAVNAHLRDLDALQRQAVEEQDRLSALAHERYSELTDLHEAQERRRILLATLNARIEQEGLEIERLAAEEKDLVRLIAELGNLLSDYPITSDAPFTELKGALTWPVAGDLLHDYGQPRAGKRLKWHGVVLAAPRGREVRAVYHGRVVFADWLAGLGLLIIVDHGEGFMTLYGYNETTLKSAGDWVAPGDVIATVGDSGGQQQSALYFEIRQGTEAIDPRLWVTRRPGSGGQGQ